ncbi:Uncharacterised protein [Mycobacteroides abscessus subsp. abscessus]|nr:Uncharacterised protein [Mycobacteroides abscessus subsp. abscessus]
MSVMGSVSFEIPDGSSARAEVARYVRRGQPRSGSDGAKEDCPEVLVENDQLALVETLAGSSL